MSRDALTSAAAGGGSNSPRVLIGAVAFCGGLIIALLGWIWYWSLGYEKLATEYGRRRGAQGAASVNGTSVLAGMFEAEGHRVRTVSRLTPRLDNASVLVWAPSDFAAPSEAARTFIEQWLTSSSGRTLVYIGRDFNAAQAYWKQALPLAPRDRRDEMQRRSALSESEHEKKRTDLEVLDAGWFDIKLEEPPAKAAQLTGPWAENVNAAAADVRWETRLAVPQTTPGDYRFGFDDQSVLLAADGEPFVRQYEQGGSRLVIVQNGSFLLNFPLVNREHRKLAGALTAHCGAEGEVLFLESTAAPHVVERDEDEQRSLFEFFAIWPLNAIIVHLAVLGFIACLAYSPIFGRPLELPGEPAADFGRHIAALGKLLGGSGNREYAVLKLQQYRRRGQRGSGKGHRSPPEPKVSAPAPVPVATPPAAAPPYS